MRCPRCGGETSGVDRCDACGAILAEAVPATELVTQFRPESPSPVAPVTPAAVPMPPAGPSSGGPLSPGQAFGPRYRITRLLGIGGMGAVYEAEDAELGVTVAIKVIRPETTADPRAAEQVEQRFKRELLLAREVTHKNVVRIHDLGEIDRIKYITMTYVDGEDLASILKTRGKLPVREALPIAREIAAGLQAAHEAGIVHRDLKPANVMVNQDGHALIMDFGIARLEGGGQAVDVAAAGRRRTTPAPTSGARASGGRSGGARTPGAAVQSLPGATVAGAIVGTMDYMAPEQAQGQPVDHRADIYAFGLILRDMLIGIHRGRDALADLLTRIQKGVPPLRSVDSAIPESLERIAARCVEVDPAVRYQNTAELCADLNQLDEDGVPLPEPKRLRWWMIAAAAVLVSAITGGVVWLTRPSVPPPAPKPVSVLIADFENKSGEAVFEGALEQALSISVEGASFVTTYAHVDAERMLTALSPGAKLNEAGARLVARREGVGMVLAGSIARDGSRYRLGLRVVNPSVDAPVTSFEATAASKDQVLSAVNTLAGRVRRALGERASQADLAAASETVTTGSLDAMREYSAGQNLLLARKARPAIDPYRRAVQYDPQFGRAYAGWAVAAYTIGNDTEGAEQWTKALKYLDRMTERERYRTTATYLLLVARDYKKAIEGFEDLVKRYPADTAGLNNLGFAYFQTLDFAKASEVGRRALQLWPKSGLYLANAALYAMYATDFTEATKQANALLGVDPNSYIAYLPLAIASAAAGDPASARKTYEKMAATDDNGRSTSTLGFADLLIYEGRPAEATPLLEKGIAEDTKAKNVVALIAKRAALAEAALLDGDARSARAAAAALAVLARSEETLAPAATVYLATGTDAEARGFAAELGNLLPLRSRAYGKIIEAQIALKKGQVVAAIDNLAAAKALADLWLVHCWLGIAHVQHGDYVAALSELELCQKKRRGEGTAIFLDDMPTVRYLAPLDYWLGRAKEGMGMPTAAEHYKAFLSLRPANSKDPLAKDARERVGKLQS